MKSMARATGASRFWLSPIQNHLLLFCVIFSLVVHLLAVIMLLALRKPVVSQMEESFTVTLSTIKRPTLKRESISHKPLTPTRPPKALVDVEDQRVPSRLHQGSEQPAIHSVPLLLQSFPNDSPPMTSVDNTEGGLGNSNGTGIEIPSVLSEATMSPKNTFSNHTDGIQSPMDKEKLTRAAAHVDPIDSDRIQSPTLARNRSNLIDVVFIISCREEMRPYINDVVEYVKREIQRYQASSKDYRVGIITSDIEFVDGPQYIRYFPLNDHLNKALQMLNSIPLHPFRTDIQLNAIQYALERCVFRPDAQRRFIVFGNDIPMCGGYSPLSVIERCRALGVVLDIHGADAEVGSLLAARTGGKWVQAFENRYDMENLQVPDWGNAYWKLQITLNDMIEQRVYIPE